jgi:hypothetical protein
MDLHGKLISRMTELKERKFADQVWEAITRTQVGGATSWRALDPRPVNS